MSVYHANLNEGANGDPLGLEPSTGRSDIGHQRMMSLNSSIGRKKAQKSQGEDPISFGFEWRAALNRAAELSRQYSRTLGTRTLDVLHVASALELGVRTFITFDIRQQNLVKAAGLRLLVPSN
jgi:hypothetical protein